MAGEARRRRLRTLLKRSGAPDVDPVRIEAAFVHESAAREGAGASNDRLEFVGDAILGEIVASYLFARYPDAREGELSRRKHALVSGDACARTARRLGLGELVLLGHGAQMTGGADNTSILADAFEAYIAALALATNHATVRAFLEREHLDPVDDADLALADAKSMLQELTQAELGITPTYFERAEGPPHERRFTSQVRVGDEVLGEGIGPSKKAAQQSAAAMALAALRTRVPHEAPVPEPSNDASQPASPDNRVIAFRARRKPSTPPSPKAPR